VCLRKFMKIVHNHALLDIVDDLYRLAMLLLADQSYADTPLEEDTQQLAIRHFTDALSACKDFGFTGPAAFAGRSISEIEAGVTYAELNSKSLELRSRIQDDFQDVKLLWIEHYDFYQNPRLFGESVAGLFPNVVLDMEEAGSCFAVGRYTACVYHLQRVMEAGLRALGAPIGESDNPSWDSILKKIDNELKKDWKIRKEFFKNNEQKISDAAAMLRAVKVAWRNPTMHVEHIYDEEKASDVLGAVKGFMRSLTFLS
jgi:HEPN domain-containing protein